MISSNSTSTLLHRYPVSHAHSSSFRFYSNVCLFSFPIFRWVVGFLLICFEEISSLVVLLLLKKKRGMGGRSQNTF
ncbi:uncharacterized protein LY89DRAFT_149294 [Mollisia scopiformis]|uniref:Uncharacterized protein n=1 Tax=Mollisia scopiformis TaxID=149040 RepID=A0A194X115_MOLSC|nr:uncharacterized protein LY89DRAFT_149294 [Mollisia scopiformis]KUJ13885.1 hypothetical protein LY89DRAFT_149294 [Mollisia scopiformis]